MFIKHIKKQKDDLIKMWGFEYKMITIVAVVRTIDHSSTKITYTLEDITGEFCTVLTSFDNVLSTLEHAGFDDLN